MPQIKSGKVVSIKMQKTIVVEVKQRKKHPLYKKILTRSKRIKVRDEMNTKLGQEVKIEETKPISKDVHFKVVEIIK